MPHASILLLVAGQRCSYPAAARWPGLPVTNTEPLTMTQPHASFLLLVAGQRCSYPAVARQPSIPAAACEGAV